jgi:ecdysone 20-monooxygenase
MSNNVPVISLFNKADIEKVLQYPSPYPFRPPTEIVSYYRQRRPDRYASLGLVNEQGPQWAKLRSKLTPKTLESRRVLSAFCPDLNEICDEFSSVIKQKRNSSDIVQNFDEIMKLMSLEVACCLILGRRMGYLQDQMEHNEEIKELGHAANNIFAIFRDAYYGKRKCFLKVVACFFFSNAEIVRK